MKIKIQSRVVYGRVLHYPMCETSKRLSLLGRRRRKLLVHTFNETDLELLRELGYEIEQVPQFPGTGEG